MPRYNIRGTGLEAAQRWLRTAAAEERQRRYKHADGKSPFPPSIPRRFRWGTLKSIFLLPPDQAWVTNWPEGRSPEWRGKLVNPWRDGLGQENQSPSAKGLGYNRLVAPD